ncbi:MAG: BrnT family toxin [Burkholderiaceae bacterium]
MVREDARHDYGETRWTAIGYVGARLYVVVYVERDGAMRIVRRRKANSREVKSYAET